MKSASAQPLFAEERRGQILQILEEKSKIVVPELCGLFDVSPATIRSDLRDLESEGKLKRTHGGAIALNKTTFELDSNKKEVEHIEEKQQIAQRAAQLVEDGDTIALDTGTTTLEFAKCLVHKKNLTVVTNDLKIAAFLEANSESHILIIGGVLRRGFHCSMGPMAVADLANINVDKVFMATNAISPQRGFTTPSLEQAEVKKALMRVASEIIMLAESSKIGKVTFIKFADLFEVDKLVTDSNINKRMQSTLKQINESLEVVIA